MAPTDEMLLHDLIEGDCKAFDTLYMRHAPHVEAFACCMLKDRAEAEDLAHDLFLKIWENRETLQDVRSFKNYLFRMTKTPSSTASNTRPSMPVTSKPPRRSTSRNSSPTTSRPASTRRICCC